MKRLLVLALLFPGTVATATPVRDKHVEAGLIAEVAAIQPGQPFWVGLRLVMDEHWHTYWRNPGDSGLDTKLRWMLPDGFAAGEIQWPYPSRISTPPLMSYGYEGETLLLVEVTPPPALTSAAVTLRARADWLMCKEICIPGRAELELTLPVAATAQPNDAAAPLFAAAREALPQMAPGGTVTAERDERKLRLRFRSGTTPPAQPYFFPYSNEWIDHAAPQQISREGEEWILHVPASPSATGWPDRVQGVVVSASGWAAIGGRPALAVDIPIGAGADSASTAPIGVKGRGMTFPAALLLAFVGGIILNLMPCVFPVISIKLLGFVEQANASRGRLLAHGAVFAAGVLVCFWALAGALLALRAGGSEIGWGFQLQSPRIVMGLAALFFSLGLSLFGVFEIGLSLTGAGQGLQAKSGYGGSFFSGLLATIVATPCTAPFMGAALGYAIALPPAAAMAIFTALGVGMASPYLALSAAPGLIRKIPRPGLWMESLKQAMGFLMMATVLWLLWVLHVQVGGEILLRMAGLFLLLGVALWIAGRWGALHRPRTTRICARLIAIAIILLGLGAALSSALPHQDNAGGHVTAGGVVWEPFTPERLAALRAEGRPVFIDFTAAWCLTCQVNKRAVLYRRDVEDAFLARGIATLRADWTDYDETITRALAGYGRNGVPVYVLYGRDPNAPPRILPELLTPSIVLDALAGI